MVDSCHRRIEHDIDEQEEKWLHGYIVRRKARNFGAVTGEVFELTTFTEKVIETVLGPQSNLSLFRGCAKAKAKRKFLCMLFVSLNSGKADC